ncbi:hypothetical protein CFC21_044458 [Triticum aestivum]|uniref:DUF4220 domain-containing protein n=2 Tax=Triticum aestivum TaxID=4565 RepID=A0A3B6FYC2_WHEAT|nr:uncharacterized protein LOC123072549 isoform X2 [Triticum aestivum]KAF7033351.1 hypothetical protein CFC21_044458 [Triticum aestivum]
MTVALLGGLSMVTRGLGFLVVTWTTVVLLGGFVSLLQKKDFWSLTVITFIELAGVVDNFGGDKWNSFAATPAGMDALGVVFMRRRLASTCFVSTTASGNIVRVVVFVKVLLGWIAHFIQGGTYMVALIGGHFGIFRWGVYIATGVSLWRLKQHDYGNTDGDSSKANMKPSLDVLYIIVVVQGAISVYRRMLNVPLENVVTMVAEAYGFKGPSVALVRDYMIETRRGCGKNPSFAKGRNLVTYAVVLMAHDKSPQDYLSGLKILSTILGPFDQMNSKKFKKQRMLIRQLILYALSSHIFRRLLVLSNPRSFPYGTEKSAQREMTKHAASIVMHIADGASVELIPQVIQCMSSLMGTFQEHQRLFSSNSTRHDRDYAKEEEDYLERLWECLHVLYVLAADENNCRLIIHTRGLLTKIMTPLASNLYHQTDHDTWENLLKESLKVIHRLTTTYGHGEGETGAKLVHEIEANLEVETVDTMMRILRCDICSRQMGKLAMGILTNLHAQMQTLDKEYLTEMLVHIYNTAANSRTSALQALATLCFQDGSNATIILQVNDSTVSSFTEDLKALSDGYHSVAEILQHACHHYTRDDKFLRILKESMTDMMPKVNKVTLRNLMDRAGGLLLFRNMTSIKQRQLYYPFV